MTLHCLSRRNWAPQAPEAIGWANARLICIAGDFTKFDQYAVQQIGRNIELIRYQRFGEGLLLLELVNAASGQDRDA